MPQTAFRDGPNRIEVFIVDGKNTNLRLVRLGPDDQGQHSASRHDFERARDTAVESAAHAWRVSLDIDDRLSWWAATSSGKTPRSLGALRPLGVAEVFGPAAATGEIVDSCAARRRLTKVQKDVRYGRGI